MFCAVLLPLKMVLLLLCLSIIFSEFVACSGETLLLIFSQNLYRVIRGTDCLAVFRDIGWPLPSFFREFRVAPSKRTWFNVTWYKIGLFPKTVPPRRRRRRRWESATWFPAVSVPRFWSAAVSANAAALSAGAEGGQMCSAEQPFLLYGITPPEETKILSFCSNI